MWQEIIVGICVLAATAFLFRHWFLKKNDSCGGCNNCSSNTKCHSPQDTNP